MIVGTLSAPLLALFCLLPGTVLELAFGSELAGAAGQLLGVACLAVQYMIALGRVAFLPVLAAIALVPVVQTIAAVSLLALSLRGVPRPATA